MKRILSEFRLYICNRWVASFPSHTFRLWFYRVIMKFSIGKKTAIFMDCIFDDGGNLIIGDNSVINGKCRIDTSGPVTIGRHVSISQEVCILTGDHNVDSPMFEGRRAAVIIEDYVWIGTRAMILKGCTIGKGAIVAGGALVTKDVAPYSVVAGVPAKAVKTRRSDLQYEVDYRRLFQ